jgi:restriction endonuclease Mrr
VPVDLDDSERRTLRQKARSATLDALRALGGEARRDAIRERALTRGGFTARELAAASPEALVEKYPRMVDHDLSWALTNLKREGLVENPKWGTWRLSSASSTKDVPAATEMVSAERLQELRKMPYRWYLRTPEWRRTRAAALARAGNCCSLDVTHTDGLEVHHRTYERLGEEHEADLVVLCRRCHRLHHKQYGRPRRQRRRAATGSSKRCKLSAIRRLLGG